VVVGFSMRGVLGSSRAFPTTGVLILLVCRLVSRFSVSRLVRRGTPAILGVLVLCVGVRLP